MILNGFVGPSNKLRSVNVDVERSVNGYPEVAAPGTPKVTPSWVKRPGLILRYNLGTGASVRGLFAQDGRAFATSGEGSFELNDNFTSTRIGTVSEDSTPAQYASNGSAGHQLLETSGGLGYIFDLNTGTFSASLASTTDFPAAAINPVYIDGYFAVQKRHTRQFNISALEDGTAWDALDVAERSIYSDNIAQMIAYNRILWLLGTKTSEGWSNSGDPDFPFTPAQAATMQMGSAVDFAAQVLTGPQGDTVIWVGRNEQGYYQVYQLRGYTPIPIGTTAIVDALQRSTDIFESYAWSYSLDNHVFYVLFIPDLTTSWCYDLTTGLWHERSVWNSTLGQDQPFLARTHCFAFGSTSIGSPGRHLVGDYRATGYIFEVDPLTYSDGIG